MMFVGPPATTDGYTSAEISRTYMEAARHQNAVIDGITWSLGSIFAGCAFSGLGQLVLLQRRILVLLENQSQGHQMR
jgi:hypothetical protein